MDPVRARTWRFDLSLLMPALSSTDDVRVVFRSILDKATAIAGLVRSSFCYDVPDDGGLARVSGYLHSSTQFRQSAVKTWIFDDRIQGEIEWTAILPGKEGE